jgi:hypothetical protein
MQELPRLRSLVTLEAVGRVDDVGRDHQVLVDEVGGVGGVREDAADLGGGEHDARGRSPAKKASTAWGSRRSSSLAGAGDQVREALRLQVPDDGAADEAAVAGDVDLGVPMAAILAMA